MKPRPPDDLPATIDQTPEILLDSFRAHPEWTDRQRDEQLDRLIARFPKERLLAAVRPRLRDLQGGDAEALLRLVEAFASSDLLRVLAEALIAQPHLSAERSWDALDLLDAAGALESYPELAERWAELNESLDEEGSLAELAEQLEEGPEETWLALQGLGAVESEIRPQIVAGLGDVALGPGLVTFLRLLTFAHDPATRSAALDVLARPATRDPELVAAWASIAADHPDPDVAARARRWLGDKADIAIAAWGGPDRPAPKLVRSLVTAVNGRGEGYIVLSSTLGATRLTAAFLCDVRRGVREVHGVIVPESPVADDAFREFVRESDRDLVEGAPELALGLLAGSLLLCGPETSPALRFWLEGTVGPRVQPRPLPLPFPGWDPASQPFDEMPRRARAVLEACPDWLDDSALTYQIAEEIALREVDPSPDPKRDVGAYRYLFEHRLQGQLELFRRMQLWMASFWQSSGDHDLGRSALALSCQLSDAQHAVPGHPFTVALTTRSLSAAQVNLRAGIDPRKTPISPGA
ncbi:MAG: hypothetical protein JO329_02285 [Planctomycetaceae bacterium]|nr:hypothetical protein [Planctomycetaceae bacterium]